MKVPEFPRETPTKENEKLYNWCYALYLELKEVEKNEQKTAVRREDGEL